VAERGFVPGGRSRGRFRWYLIAGHFFRSHKIVTRSVSTWAGWACSSVFAASFWFFHDVTIRGARQAGTGRVRYQERPSQIVVDVMEKMLMDSVPLLRLLRVCALSFLIIYSNPFLCFALRSTKCSTPRPNPVFFGVWAVRTMVLGGVRGPCYTGSWYSALSAT